MEQIILAQNYYNLFLNNLETIKNVSLFLVSSVVFIGLLILYIKIIFAVGKIKKINKNIEEWQKELDQYEVNNVGYPVGSDLTGEIGRYKIRTEQGIQRLKREKSNLLEKISIYKIFKK